MGIDGGAIATIIGQIVCTIIAVVIFPTQLIDIFESSDDVTLFIGLYEALYAGTIADTICFICVIFIFGSEYRKIGKKSNNMILSIL